MTTGVQPEGVVLLCLGHSSCSDALLESAMVTSCVGGVLEQGLKKNPRDFLVFRSIK